MPHSFERVAKYNQLLRIEEQLGRTTVYAGLSLPSLQVSPELAAWLRAGHGVRAS